MQQARHDGAVGKAGRRDETSGDVQMGVEDNGARRDRDIEDGSGPGDPSTSGDSGGRVKVESPTAPGERRSADRRSGSKQSLWTPRLKEGSRMPLQGPEVLDILFRLGVLTIDQTGGLLPRPIGTDRVGEVLAELAGDGRKSRSGAKSGTRAPLVRRVRHPFRYSDSSKRSQWKTLYYLSGEGLGYVARRRDLYPSVAESIYRGVLEEARIDHALLRNEFYRRLVAQVPRTIFEDDTENGDGLEVETMWAERGMKPIKLAAVEGNDRRYLNPDGMVEIAGMVGQPARPYRLKVYLESDTGSEDMDWQVTGHADKYAEHFLSLLESQGAQEDLENELPVVLFVSPAQRRTFWVRRKIRDNGFDPDSVFHAARKVFKENGKSLPALFWFTNLEWLQENGGPLGASYWPLSAAGLEPLIVRG